MKGDVFSNDLIDERSGNRGAEVLPRGIDAWIAYKRENEADLVRLRPVPVALQLSYGW